MNQVATIPAPRAFNGPQVALIKRTVAKDCDANEFDHFMAVAQQLQLDPLRKQICAMVFSKDDPKKRNMSIIVQIDGLRAIANRCGDYRASEKAPLIEYDTALKGPDNPLGIVRCEVTLWRFAHGQWHPQVGEAYWEEFAPVKDVAEGGWEWVDTGEVWEDSGKPKKRKQPKGDVTKGVEGNWAKMGRIMIAKCAEAQALRKGWPEQFAGVYVEEEMHRAEVIDVTASEVLAEHDEQRRLSRVGAGDGLLFVFETGGNLVQVDRGQVADRLTFFYQRQATTAQEIIDFRTRNEASLKTFWAWAPNDALEVKKIAEQRVEVLSTKAPAVTDDASLFETLKAEGLAIISVEGVADRLAAHGKWLANVNAKQSACSEAEREEIKTLKKTIKSELGQNSADAMPASTDGGASA